MLLRRIDKLAAIARQQEQKGLAVVAPESLRLSVKGIPPPGVAYSKNFARYHQMGAFSVQTRD